MHNALRQRQVAVFTSAVVMLSTVIAEASTLDAVLGRISDMGISPLSAVIGNVASTSGSALEMQRGLQPGDRVIVGYSLAGIPIFATAGVAGVVVSEAHANDMGRSGLAAGLYPPGSALFSLPPGGQLSLFEEAEDGRRLDRARDLVLSRVDGSVTNIVNGLLLPDLIPAAMVYVYDANASRDLVSIDEINATVLGAVNAGEIVTRIDISWVQSQVEAQVDMSLAGVSIGANLALQEVSTETARARALSLSQLGGGPDSAALALNMSTNAMEVTGRVKNSVSGQSARISTTVTTVIGAVNGGSVNGASR